MCLKEIVFSVLFFALCFDNLEADKNDVLPIDKQYKEYKIVKDGKQFFVFPLFGGVGLVRFANSPCGGDNSLEGTCYLKRQCSNLDGVATAKCASGAGVCCVFQRTCGDTSSLNNTYFVSPGYPSTYSGGSTCTITIPPASGSCQVRLDFNTLNLAQPNVNGTCINDALIVNGGATNVPIICGQNSGQHMYIDFNGNSSIVLTILTNSATSVARSWNIKITQYACDCPYKAPSGCLQYYRTTSGTARSFNYGSTGTQNGTRQLVYQNYGVCVEMQPGYCSIEWAQSSDDDYSFTVSNNTYTAVSDSTIGTTAAEMFGSNCTTDFVVIPGPIFSNGTLVNSDRFCGNGFAAVVSYSKPFVLTVVTNGNEVNDTGNRGFALSFTQELCTGSVLLG